MTLLELVLVVTVIFVLSALIAPRFSDFFPALQVRKSADRVFAWAQKARSEAAVTGTRQRLVFDAGTFWIEREDRPLKDPGVFTPGTRETLPEGVTLELQADGAGYVEFLPDGTSSGGSVVISNDRGDQRTVRVADATSEVTIESTEPP